MKSNSRMRRNIKVAQTLDNEMRTTVNNTSRTYDTNNS